MDFLDLLDLCRRRHYRRDRNLRLLRHRHRAQYMGAQLWYDFTRSHHHEFRKAMGPDTIVCMRCMS